MLSRAEQARLRDGKRCAMGKILHDSIDSGKKIFWRSTTYGVDRPIPRVYPRWCEGHTPTACLCAGGC